MTQNTKIDSRPETYKHIQTVQRMLGRVVRDLLKRSEVHDQSKLTSPEVELFDEFTPKLAGCTYGSEEYKGFLAALKPALDHHYAKNSHHPEHYPEGVKGMSLFDLVEMLCDWKAATLRHKDGDILKSVEINQKRFGYSDELKQILLNSLSVIGGYDDTCLDLALYDLNDEQKVEVMQWWNGKLPPSFWYTVSKPAYNAIMDLIGRGLG